MTAQVLDALALIGLTGLVAIVLIGVVAAGLLALSEWRHQ